MLSEADLIILGRAALAAALGFVIGWERQVTGAAIRARAIGLAALTAAALTALGHEIFATGTDRIVQGIVTGIGFLGAGVILRGASGEVRGLTTAAAMWAMTAIGVAIGSGYELLGIGLAALVYLIVAWGEWPGLAALQRRKTGRTAPDVAGRRSGEASSGSADAVQQPRLADLPGQVSMPVPRGVVTAPLHRPGELASWVGIHSPADMTRNQQQGGIP